MLLLEGNHVMSLDDVTNECGTDQGALSNTLGPQLKVPVEMQQDFGIQGSLE